MVAEDRLRQLEHQLTEYDSLSNAAGRYGKIDLLNELAWMLCDIDAKRALALSETAYSLAGPSDDGQPPYQAGMAYSLRTQGYLNQRLGNYALGLTQLHKAREICETLQLHDVLPDVLDGIAGIHFQIGDLPEALSGIYTQLDAAQRTGKPDLIANAHNNLAAYYFESGDSERGIATLRMNLKTAIETGNKRIECLSHLNLGEAYLREGDYRRAAEYGANGLPISQAAGFELFEVYAYSVLGKAYRGLGETSQAIDYFERALELSTRLGSKVTESLVLLDLGQAHMEIRQADQALGYLEQAVATAQSIDARSELFRGHLLLSELHEQQGEYPQALSHYRQYQAAKDRVHGEMSHQRLKALQVAHETETARKEAEILQLKAQQLEREIAERLSVEAVLNEARDRLEQQVQLRTAELSNSVALLQGEIAERERAQAEVQQMVETLEQRVAARTEELATFFDLTLLTGQTGDITDLIEHAMPRILEATRSHAICIHLMDPDRSSLSLAAQWHLQTPTSLRIVELPADFQRWLKQASDPLATTDLARLMALPSELRLSDYQTYLGAQIRIGDRTEGILSCYRFADSGYSIDEIALVMALAEQVGIMLENHRLRQDAEEVAAFQERQRLARDLHDSVSQSLYSLSLFSRAGREAAEDGDLDRLNHSLTELERNTLHALREMRLLLYELRPANLEPGGLIPALEMRLDSVERRAGLQLDVQLDGCRDLPPSFEIDLYHIIVEALNNVVRHAAATRLTLQLIHADRRLELCIADNGRGFDATQSKGGMGLRNIQERVARLNGRLHIASKPGSGTRLEATIPCPGDARQ